MFFTFDFETALIRPGKLAPEPACMAYRWDDGPISVVPASEARELFAHVLLLRDVVYIGANVAYDFGVAAQAWSTMLPEPMPYIFLAYQEGRVRDVQNRQKLMDIALGEYRYKEVSPGVFVERRYSLAALYKRHTGNELPKEDTWRLRYGELLDVPFEDWPIDAKTYPADDVRATRDVYLSQEKELEVEDAVELILGDEPAQNRADWALHLASAWGMRTDPAGIRKLETICQERIDELIPDLRKAKLIQKGPKGYVRKVRVAQALRLEANGGAYDGLKLTKTGQEKRAEYRKLKAELDKMAERLVHEARHRLINDFEAARAEWQQIKYISVDEESCDDSADPLLMHYSEYTKMNSLLTGHVKAMWKGVELPIHTRFEVLMETGRTSSSGPNIQNVRQAEGARECFVPRPGHCYVACDFDRAELHTLAQVCINLFGRSNLAEMLNSGIDPHTKLGAQFANIPYEDMARMLEDGDEAAGVFRKQAKPANFGLPGGMGVKGFIAYSKQQYGMLFDERQASKIINDWRTTYPVVADDYLGYIRDCMETIYDAKGNEVDTRGRAVHFVSKRIRGRVRYCALANTYFQGLAADGAKAALFELASHCYVRHQRSALWGCRPVNFIHDEILMEVPRDGRLTEAAEEMRAIMVDTFNEYTPDVPVSAAPAAMDRWSKRARQIISPSGELEIWRYGQ